jgi:UDP-GlcNAc:undecaprenyl-phosphate/decaprenyl-phosphate GlcNAc-1-phosphate transferase
MINYSALLLALSFNIILNIATIKFWADFSFVQRYENNYEGIQKIHTKIIPRLGGLNSYLSLLAYIFISGISVNLLLTTLMISAIPLVFYATKEDITHKVAPYIRIFSIFIASLIFFLLYNNYNFPIIDISVLGDIINIYFVGLSFFIFALISISNGTNIIDGANGLSSMTVLFQLLSLLFLSYKVSDFLLFDNLLILISFIILFLIFNFPLGKIFLGDCGAYLWGWLSGMLVILFYGRHPELSTWGAILILIYPIIETIFSTIRKKFYDNISPLIPDPNHLHLKVFFALEKFSLENKLKISPINMVTLALLIIWSSPLYLIPFVYHSPFLIFLSIMYVCSLYFIIYTLLPRKK